MRFDRQTALMLALEFDATAEALRQAVKRPQAPERIPFPEVGREWIVKFYRSEPYPVGDTGYSTAWLAVVYARGTRAPEFFGISYRSPADPENGRIGKAIALRRAVAAMDGRTRSEPDLMYGTGREWALRSMGRRMWPQAWGPLPPLVDREEVAK